MGGRKAARIKAGILKLSMWTNSHPTFCVPKRKRHLAAAPDASAAKALPYAQDAPADKAVA